MLLLWEADGSLFPNPYFPFSGSGFLFIASGIICSRKQGEKKIKV
jgi:hypothetical protein